MRERNRFCSGRIAPVAALAGLELSDVEKAALGPALDDLLRQLDRLTPADGVARPPSPDPEGPEMGPEMGRETGPGPE